MTDITAPRRCGSDPVLGTPEGPFTSYGPRVERKATDGIGIEHTEVTPPAEGERPHYWSVYLWCPAELVWRWSADCVSAYVAKLCAAGIAGTDVEWEGGR